MMALITDEKVTKPLRLGVLPVSVEVLEGALLIPDGYKIASLHFDEIRRCLNIVLASDELPELQEGRDIPHVNLLITQHTLPDYPGYRKYTSKIAKY